MYAFRTMFFGEAITYESLIGRWRQTVQMFGHIFCDDVGIEPGSIISELGGFPVKETKFRRDMEKLRNTQQRDLSIEVKITSNGVCCFVMYLCSIRKTALNRFHCCAF